MTCKSPLGYQPLYDEFSVKASWYVAVNNMGTTAMDRALSATAADIQALHAKGHEIGSHTMDHFYFGNSTEKQRRQQLQGCSVAGTCARHSPTPEISP